MCIIPFKMGLKFYHKNGLIWNIFLKFNFIIYKKLVIDPDCKLLGWKKTEPNVDFRGSALYLPVRLLMGCLH